MGLPMNNYASRKGSMKIYCDGCNEVLKEQGALVFSPPKNGDCAKFHICKECWPKIRNAITLKETQ